MDEGTEREKNDKERKRNKRKMERNGTKLFTLLVYLKTEVSVTDAA